MFFVTLGLYLAIGYMLTDAAKVPSIKGSLIGVFLWPIVLVIAIMSMNSNDGDGE